MFVYEVPCIFWHYINVDEVSLITLKKLLQSAMDLLQIATVHMYMWVKFTFPYYVEAMHERSLVSVKVEPRSTSRLNSALFILLLFYDVIKIYVRYRA